MPPDEENTHIACDKVQLFMHSCAEGTTLGVMKNQLGVEHTFCGPQR
jgi:hypothetical protein